MKLGDEATFGELTALRGRLTDAIRAERRDGTPTVLRRLGIVLDAVDDNLARAAGSLADDPAKGAGIGERLAEMGKSWDGPPGGTQARQAAVGDTVQWTSGGVDQLPEPRQIRQIVDLDGRQYALVEGSNTGLPVEELSVVKSAREAERPPTGPELRGRDEGLAPIQADGVPAARGANGEGAGRPADLPGNPGVQEASGPAGFSEEVAGRYADARAATKDLETRYESGPVGDILAPRGQFGSFRPTASNVAGKLFDTPERLAAFIAAAKDHPDLPKVMADFAAFSMHKAAVRDGLLSPTLLNKWMANHEYVFRQFPELRVKFADAGKAQSALDKAVAYQKEALAQFQTNAVERLLSGRDPMQAIGQALKVSDEFAALATLAKDDPNAFAGLRRIILDFMMLTARSKAHEGMSAIDRIDAAVLQKFLLQNRQNLARLFDDAELKSMFEVAADIRRTNRNIEALKSPDGPVAPQNREGQFATAFRKALSAHAGKAIGATADAALGPFGGVAGFFAGAVWDAMRSARANNVERLVVEMLLDTKMAAIWMAKVPAKPEAAATFARRLRALATNQVMNAIDVMTDE